MLLLGLLFVIPSLVVAFSSTAPTTVTVVGGTGFVGSRVCKILTEQYGASVTSVSKSGIVPEWCYGNDDEDEDANSGDDEWISKVTWKSVDLLSGDDAKIAAAIGSPDAIVSCVGVVGTDLTDLLEGNGKANIAAFGAASSPQRAAFVSVCSEVSELQGTSWLPEFIDGYLNGKKQAEKAALEAVDGDASRLVVVKPSFIYGGDSFGLLPPRVNYAYGSGVEELLTFGVFQFLADATPGLIKVALRPPVSVDAVAGACAAAAMGKVPGGGVLDGTKAIKEVTNDPPATGLTEAVDWAKENAMKVYDWAKVEVPKAIDAGKKMIDEKK
jgi:nucleoside-diphosphate-sugar epimerase